MSQQRVEQKGGGWWRWWGAISKIGGRCVPWFIYPRTHCETVTQQSYESNPTTHNKRRTSKHNLTTKPNIKPQGSPKSKFETTQGSEEKGMLPTISWE